MGLFDFLKPKDVMVKQDEVQPVQEVIASNTANNSFEFIVEDVFNISGRGVVVTGKVIKGSININDQVTIFPSGIVTVVTGIEKLRKNLSSAMAGDNVGLLLDGVSRGQLNRGDILVK